MNLEDYLFGLEKIMVLREMLKKKKKLHVTILNIILPFSLQLKGCTQILKYRKRFQLGGSPVYILQQMRILCCDLMWL